MTRKRGKQRKPSVEAVPDDVRAEGSGPLRGVDSDAITTVEDVVTTDDIATTDDVVDTADDVVTADSDPEPEADAPGPDARSGRASRAKSTREKAAKSIARDAKGAAANAAAAKAAAAKTAKTGSASRAKNGASKQAKKAARGGPARDDADDLAVDAASSTDLEADARDALEASDELATDADRDAALAADAGEGDADGLETADDELADELAADSDGGTGSDDGDALPASASDTDDVDGAAAALGDSDDLTAGANGDTDENDAQLDAASDVVAGAQAGGDAGEAGGDGEDDDAAVVFPTSAATMDAVQLKHLVESLIFASDRPLTVQRLRQLTRVGDIRRLEQSLADLTEDYRERGVILQQVSGGYQFRTRTQFSAWVQQLIAGRPVRLSRAQLETLAIIAYRQPITRPEIDDIRGVDSSATLKLLIDRMLIRVLGKREEVGRPMLYGTTKEFLDFFSLGDLRELPTLREYSELTAESRKVMSDRLGIAADGSDPDGSDPDGGPDGSDGGDPDGGNGHGGNGHGGNGHGGNGHGGGGVPPDFGHGGGGTPDNGAQVSAGIGRHASAGAVLYEYAPPDVSTDDELDDSLEDASAGTSSDADAHVGAVADEQEAELASPDGGASDGVGIDEPVSEPAPSDAGAHAGTADDGDAPETASSGASADMGGTPDPEHTHGASMSTSVGTERAHVGISLGRGRIADLDADDVSFHEDPPDGASAQDARAPDALSAFWAASAAVDRSNAAVAGDGDDAPPDTWFDPSLSDDAGESAESDDTDDSAESSDAAPDAAVRGAVVKAPRVTSTPE